MHEVTPTMNSIQRITGGALAALYLLFAPWPAMANVALLGVLLGSLFVLRPVHLGELRRLPPAWFMAALFGLVVLGLLYTPAPWSWASLNLGKYAKLVYALVILLLLLQVPQWQRWALRAYVVAMLFVLVSTWLNVWLVLPWSYSKEPGWGLSHHVLFDYIIQNVMMSLFVVFAFTQVQWRAWSWRSTAWLIVTVLAGLSISHLSVGRTGLLLLVAGLLAWVAYSGGGRRLLMGLPLAVLAGVLLVMSSSTLKSRFELAWQEFGNRHADPLSSIGQRAYNYEKTPQLIAEQPVWGHGTGAFHTEICRFVDKPEWCPIFNWHPHNQFLMFGADHGLIGMLVYAGLIVSLLVMAWRSPHAKPRIWLAALAAILLVDSMINTPLFSSSESHFFVYMMALLVAINASPVLANEPAAGVDGWPFRDRQA